MYLIIDGIFRGLKEQVDEYQKLLKDVLTKDKYGGKWLFYYLKHGFFYDNPQIFLMTNFLQQQDPCVPMYFYIRREDIEAERRKPLSQPRHASFEGSGQGPLFLWNQALLIISQLLTAGLLDFAQLDPVRRHLPSFSRPRATGRYSAFQVSLSRVISKYWSVLDLRSIHIFYSSPVS